MQEKLDLFRVLLSHYLKFLVTFCRELRLQSEFNDPYDGLPKFSLLSCKDEGLQVWAEFLKDVESYDNPEIEKEELAQKISNTLHGQSNPSISWLKEYEQERMLMLESFLNRIRICCFAKSPKNKLLWAVLTIISYPVQYEKSIFHLKEFAQAHFFFWSAGYSLVYFNGGQLTDRLTDFL